MANRCTRRHRLIPYFSAVFFAREQLFVGFILHLLDGALLRRFGVVHRPGVFAHFGSVFDGEDMDLEVLILAGDRVLDERDPLVPDLGLGGDGMSFSTYCFASSSTASCSPCSTASGAACETVEFERFLR